MFRRRSALVAVAVTFAAQAAHADVTISSKPTQNMSCDAGVCTATAQKAVLNVADLQTMLASGDVAVKTGSLAKDIDINQPLSWTSSSRLTLDAQRSVQIEKQVTVAGQGALTVTTNDTGDNGRDAKGKSEGEFIIVPEHGSVQFWDAGSSLMIDGNNYTLVYDIETLASDIAANPAGFYALATDYDASVDGTYSSPPILNSFSGSFEGLGNQFINVRIGLPEAQEKIGFFTYLGPGGVLRNLILSRSSVRWRGKASYAALLLAENDGGTVASSHVDGRLDGKAFATGGLVGINGSVNAAKIEFSSASVEIARKGMTSEEYAGGLAGINAQGSISASYAKGNLDVSGGGMYGGGLVGLNSAAIDTSYSISAVSVTGNVLGFAGGFVATQHGPGKIDNCYATGSATVLHGDRWAGAGGFMAFNGDVGWSGGTVAHSYSTGTPKIVLGGSFNYLGGFAGGNGNGQDALTIDYWDTTTSGESAGFGTDYCPGVEGLSDAQLKSGLPAGFDPKIWGSDPSINNGYPYLRANPPS